MKAEMRILAASSAHIKIFAVCLSAALIALVFVSLGGGAPWWIAFAWFMFLALLSILLEFIDDRRIEQIPESELPFTLRRQDD